MLLTRATALLTLLLSPLALSAPALDLFGNQSPIKANDELSVPGDNPLLFCTKPDRDILTIERVDLTPNPPLPGTTLVIKATGNFHERVEKGATVVLEVKYGYIRIVNQTADLCEQLKNVDMECPLEKGEMSFVKKVDLPKEIPPGTYTVTANVISKDQKRITCLQTAVSFNV